MARPIVSSYAAPIATGYAGLGYSRAIYGGYRSGYYGKREAEAEPEADADALYGTYGGYGLGYSRSIVSSYAAPAIAAPAVASYAAPAIATGYAGIARPAISS